jgi:branched-chain amino acid transport system permease protein
MQGLLNIAIDGAAYGMVLFVIAVGMSITLGLMRFVNLSHGAFAMIGGYLTAILIREAGLNFWFAWALAVVVTMGVAAALEMAVLRHLYRRTELSQVLFTIGLSFFLIATTNALAGPQIQLIRLPEWLTGSIDLGFRTLPAQRALVFAVGLLVVLGITLTMSKTRFGIWLRAAVDNPETASSLGIPIRLVQCVTFSVGAGLAAVGGVLGAELMPLEPYYALKYLVLVLVVVAVGGMGSIWGTLVAALVLGTIETASKYLASGWGSLFFFLAMAVLLAWRPNGILKK